MIEMALRMIDETRLIWINRNSSLMFFNRKRQSIFNEQILDERLIYAQLFRLKPIKRIAETNYTKSFCIVSSLRDSLDSRSLLLRSITLIALITLALEGRVQL
jgi:hypothetical protein